MLDKLQILQYDEEKVRDKLRQSESDAQRHNARVHSRNQKLAIFGVVISVLSGCALFLYPYIQGWAVLFPVIIIPVCFCICWILRESPIDIEDYYTADLRLYKLLEKHTLLDVQLEEDEHFITVNVILENSMHHVYKRTLCTCTKVVSTQVTEPRIDLSASCYVIPYAPGVV